MDDRILVIDDDHHLLSALRRQLSDTFEITTAQGGEEALAVVQEAAKTQKPFAVALCDMRMPGLDGIETLKRLRDLAPETVRMMLTGNADQQTSIEAINQGAIFRFFTKPCPPDRLREGLLAGVKQYRLITAERDLLEKTLAGSVRVLVDVASLNDPVAAGTATRLREWLRLLTSEFKMPHRWQLDIAASLLPIGLVALPPELLTKRRQGEPLTDLERSMFEHVPEVARNLVANIPRLAPVAEILYLQDKGFDGSGFPPDGPQGKDIPLDARLLKILKDIAEAAEGGPLTVDILKSLDKRRDQYDPTLLPKVRACLQALGEAAPSASIEVALAALQPGQMVLSDIRLSNGHLILAANTQLSPAQIERLRNLRKIFSFIEPIKVRI
ncbi:HD domain-containing phosphohydrolase [Pararhodospirillum photometricum]|uniref:Response regulator containing a CheY-like receiver domain and an HD-GYP domain n=1 Tax=Pararhodospirillum photometricum DSM 122 TaxID=1150469 RepID=H6SK45_PARPM|nr:HD domain-containing phosphohydrolase [Pararhodospirillum photometricum]CCG08360.1 Response regulator containing a CheY-like receiver domain and an HD-GYP domain [Pararhodospirillum photometricum DSM 122]